MGLPSMTWTRLGPLLPLLRSRRIRLGGKSLGESGPHRAFLFILQRRKTTFLKKGPESAKVRAKLKLRSQPA